MQATPAVNPQFNSQTKENMTLVKTNFGSQCKIGDKRLDAVCKGDCPTVATERDAALVLNGSACVKLHLRRLEP